MPIFKRHRTSKNNLLTYSVALKGHENKKKFGETVFNTNDYYARTNDI
jgi:hypothetical protein